MQIGHTRWPIFAALVVGAATVAVFWYFVLSNPKGEALPASGGHYTEGTTQTPERINPLFAATNPADADLSALVFSGLVRLGPDGTPQPDLAERWEITGNGQSYVFHLRHGVAWHDGEDFDADDVLFTFKAIADPAFKGDPVLAGVMRGVVVTERDPFSVEFRLEQPYAPFLAYLTVGILPKHLLDGYDANQLFNADFNSRPVGTGPYRLSKRTNRGVELDANSTFYLGPPLISGFELRTYADANALDEALRAGDIDGALLGPDAPAGEIDALRGDTRFTLHDEQSATYNIAYLDTRLPVFAEKAVRGALWHALDVPGIATSAAGGRGVPAVSPIVAGSWAASGATAPEFDPGAAATALETAGWRRGTDGVRAKDGQRLAFSLSTSNEPGAVAIANEIARAWQAIGAEVTVVPIAASAYVNETLLTRDYEAALVTVDPGPDPDPYPFWHSSQVAPPGQNLANYASPRMDDALERARQTTDVQRRKDLYALFDGYFISDAPSVPLFYPVYVYAQSARVHGFSDGLLFTPASRFGNVRDWYVQTRVER